MHSSLLVIEVMKIIYIFYFFARISWHNGTTYYTDIYQINNLMDMNTSFSVEIIISDDMILKTCNLVSWLLGKMVKWAV